MNKFPAFLPGDKVKYVGNKHSQELGTKRGTVDSCVLNEPNAIVVDFGDEFYICEASSLARFSSSPVVEEKTVEVTSVPDGLFRPGQGDFRRFNRKAETKTE